MSERKIRFLTSAEKMSNLGKHSRTDERMEGDMEIDPNGFVSVLINGNCFQVELSRHLSRVRWMLISSASLVPGQICIRRPRWRGRSCH